MLKQQPQRLTKATQLTKTCRQLQIKQINTIPTRKNKLLDPILTNKSDSKVYKCTNKNIFNSDHDLVLAKPIFKLHKQRQPKKKTITTRTDKMEDTINERGKIDWNELINTNNDPQSKLNVFYNTIDDIRKTCQPIKTVKTRNEKEWMTPNIKLLIKQRQKAYRQNTNGEGWQIPSDTTSGAERKTFTVSSQKMTVKNRGQQLTTSTANQNQNKNSTYP